MYMMYKATELRLQINDDTDAGLNLNLWMQLLISFFLLAAIAHTPALL